MFLPIMITAILAIAISLVIGSVYMHEGGAGLRRRAVPILLLSGVLVAIGVGMPLLLQGSALIWPIAVLTSLVCAGVAIAQAREVSRSGGRVLAWVLWALALFFAALAIGALTLGLGGQG